MTSSAHLYDADFFADVDRGSAQSAAHTVPLLISLIQSLCPSQHIVDVGCGTGAWCSAWQRNGWNVTGIDGGYAATHLRNKNINFIAHDLTQPITLSQNYDAASCLEVAEHLPEHAAKTLISSLTSLAPIVIFSAATPGQGGTGHVNEQPLAYWRDLFHEFGFTALDLIRPSIYQDRRICPWYRYNMLIFIRSDLLSNHRKMFPPTAIIEKGHTFRIYDSVLWRLRKAVLRGLPVHIVTQIAKLKNRLLS